LILCAQTQTDCLEVFCISVLIPTEKHQQNPEYDSESGGYALMVYFLMHVDYSNSDNVVWNLHPWLLAEISNLYFLFFINYLAYIMKNLDSALEQNFTAFDKRRFDQRFIENILEEIQLRLKYLLKRNANIKQICEHVLVQFKKKLNTLQDSYFDTFIVPVLTNNINIVK